MERLTERLNDELNGAWVKIHGYISASHKLAEYEDLEEQGKLLKLPCAVGDKVYDLVLCNDGKYHIFEMKVCNISPFGDLRKGKVWNVYLEDKYTKAYRSFYDFSKNVFLTREEAEAAMKNYEHQSNNKQTPKSTNTAWERIRKHGKIKKM